MRKVLRVLVLFASVGLSLPARAADGPPQITWEWFNAAEIQRKLQSPRGDAVAARYFRMAAERGNVPAAYKLGEMLEEGRGVEQNHRQALWWYRRAAKAGDRFALFKIGLFHQKGLAVKRDGVEAARAYAAAADAGNLWGLHMLAFMLADGDGLATDPDLATRYFEKSLPHTRDHWAMWRLARLLETSDPLRADQLMAEAARAGNPEASRRFAMAAEQR